MAETKRRKQRRSGQIILRGDNKYQIKIFLGRDEKSGTKMYYSETFRGTKSEAETRLRTLLTRRDNEEPLKESNISFSSFVDLWLTRKDKLGRIRERSATHYERLVSSYLLPSLGNVSLKGITPSTIEALYAELNEKGLSPSTRKYVHVLLADIFKVASKLDYLRKNPMVTIDPPTLAQKETRALTSDQVSQFLTAIEGAREYPLFAFAFLTGARPCEYLALQWSDVDDQAMTMTIHKSIVWRKSGDWYLTDPKSQSSRRTLPIMPSINKTLAEHRRRQNEEKLRAGASWNRKNDFVFTDEAGEPLSLSRVRYLWKRALRTAGLPMTRLYATRHSTATALLGAKVNIKTISERLGHSNVAITLARYANVTFDQQKDADEKLERAFFG